jgi:hypothetical protein
MDVNWIKMHNPTNAAPDSDFGKELLSVLFDMRPVKHLRAIRRRYQSGQLFLAHDQRVLPQIFSLKPGQVEGVQDRLRISA